MTDGHHHSTDFAPGSRSWNHLPRVLPFLRPYWRLEGTSLGLLFVGVALSLAQPWPMAFLVDSVLSKSKPHGLVPHLFGTNLTVLVAVAAGLSFVVALAVNALSVAEEYVNTKLDSRLTLDFRRQVFHKAQRLSLHYFDRRRAGYFAQNINTHTTALGQIVVGIPALLQSVLTLIGMFVISCLLDPVVALASLAVVPFIYRSTIIYSRRIEPSLVHTRDQEGLALSVIQEAMQMIRVVLTFRREDHELKRFSEQAEYALGLRVSLTVRQTLFSLVVNVFTAAGSALVLGLGAMHVLSHRMSVGDLLVLVGYIASVYKPLQTISYTMSSWQDQLVSFWLALEMLDEEPEVMEVPGAETLNHVGGRVTFEDVSFSYPDRPGALTRVACDIPPGSVIGVVGPTGAGKTTFTALISRLYDPTEGRVLLDGRDLRELTLDTVRSSVAVVLQDPLLFLGSIADNIRYGRLDATDEEIIEAAKAAHAHGFISALPDGYDTKIGERGATLSGGERQRICIARAFLKDAPIVVLDEPTSAVDSGTEGEILEALSRLSAGRTTIIVAHRLSTLKAANRILVVDGGRIVEEGPHDELVAMEGGLYARLWASQAGLDRRAGPPREIISSSAGINPFSSTRDEHRIQYRPAVDAAKTPVNAGSPVLKRSPRVVLLGMMTKTPVAGVVWQTLHYMLGLKALGLDPYYVEAHARTPSMLMHSSDQDSAELAASFISRVMDRFGFAGRWAFHALHDDGRCLGMEQSELMRLYADAAVILNLHGGTEPREEHSSTGRLIYIETDPCQLQVELAAGEARSADFLGMHQAFFTFGENIGRPDCLLPVPDRFQFVPTRQPVVLDLWDRPGLEPGRAYTTVGNWRQQWRDVCFKGEVYGWSKHSEFLKVLDLPARTGAHLELALSSYAPDDVELLEEHGWAVRPALDVSVDVDNYRRYIQGSRAEFTVAKDQNIRMRSGWFSDRSATYLAAGRPVVTQDTGFGCSLPVGEGLFAYSSLNEAVDAIAHIEADYPLHSRRARDVAADCFAAEKVLAKMMDHVGVVLRAQRRHRGADPLEGDLMLTPLSRRPLALPAETRQAVLSRAIPSGSGPVADRRPTASIVVVTHDNLVCLRLCVESVLTLTAPGTTELVVVDNASTDGTATYLAGLAESNPSVRVVTNGSNTGFAPAVNKGLAESRSDHFVIMNDDVIVCDGWLDGLLVHLRDPGIGAVGPVTGRIGTASEVPARYDRLSELRSFANSRRDEFGQSTFDVPMLAMFCMALRRGTFERVGPLDEGFGIGLFEDDDYSSRLTELGYRLVCAAGVYVHHFGEASFGNLVPSGEYGRLFVSNRARYEQKWGVEWRPHERMGDPSYADSMQRVREVLERELPPDAVALVLTKGDQDLLDFGRRAAHFPQDSSGQYAGYHPADSQEAIEWLSRDARKLGASHLVIPWPSAWWLTRYPGLAEHLVSSARVVAHSADVAVFELTQQRTSVENERLESVP